MVIRSQGTRGLTNACLHGWQDLKSYPPARVCSLLPAPNPKPSTKGFRGHKWRLRNYWPVWLCKYWSYISFLGSEAWGSGAMGIEWRLTRKKSIWDENEWNGEKEWEKKSVEWSFKKREKKILENFVRCLLNLSSACRIIWFILKGIRLDKTSQDEFLVEGSTSYSKCKTLCLLCTRCVLRTLSTVPHSMCVSLGNIWVN